MGKIIRNGIKFSGTVDTANNINYDNSLSGLEAKTTQEAIDEINDTVDELNESLEDRPQFIYDENGKITGYTTKIGGADTVFPFKSSGLSDMSGLGAGYYVGTYTTTVVVEKDSTVIVSTYANGYEHSMTTPTNCELIKSTTQKCYYVVSGNSYTHHLNTYIYKVIETGTITFKASGGVLITVNKVS